MTSLHDTALDPVRRVVAVRHVQFEDLGLLAPLLARRGWVSTYLDAGIDALSVEQMTAADLLVVLGGPIGVGDQDRYPYLTDEISAVRARVKAGRPTLGICLGAQILARALGADVRPTGHTEIGYGKLALTEVGHASVLAPLAEVPVLHWHSDEFAVPDGAARLAATSGFPNQAFSLGPTLLGLQFHLEADHTQIERWLVGHAHELAVAGIDPRTVRADALRYGPALSAAATTVIESWIEGIENR